MLLYCWTTNRISHVHITSGSRLYYRNDVSSTCKLMVNINMYSDYWHDLNTTIFKYLSFQIRSFSRSELKMYAYLPDHAKLREVCGACFQ